MSRLLKQVLGIKTKRYNYKRLKIQTNEPN